MKPLLLLAALPLVLTGCGGGSSSSGTSDTVTSAGAADAQTAEVDMNDSLKFAPTTVRAKVGALTLDVKNVGKVPHNLVFDQEALGKTGTVAGGESAPLKLVFDKAGTFAFQCTFHDGMVGKVVVS